MQLKTGWPYLSLPPELAARHADRSSTVLPDASPNALSDAESIAEPSLAHGLALPFTLEPLPMIMNQADGMPSPPAPAPVTPSSAPRTQPPALPLPSRPTYSERTAVVQGHLQLMEQFLRMQEAVMRLFLNGVAPDVTEPLSPPVGIVPSVAVAPAPVVNGNLHANGNGVTSGNGVVTGHAFAPAPVEVAPPTPAVALAPASGDPARLKSVLLGLVSAKTGYPQEMLDLNANLEADLGIDSIKRVEILGAFNRETQLLDAKDIEHVSSLKTLGAMLDFFQAGSLRT
jgi:hypothetical protein